jgi:hypothetical protein
LARGGLLDSTNRLIERMVDLPIERFQLDEAAAERKFNRDRQTRLDKAAALRDTLRVQLDQHEAMLRQADELGSFFTALQDPAVGLARGHLTEGQAARSGAARTGTGARAPKPTADYKAWLDRRMAAEKEMDTKELLPQEKTQALAEWNARNPEPKDKFETEPADMAAGMTAGPLIDPAWREALLTDVRGRHSRLRDQALAAARRAQDINREIGTLLDQAVPELALREVSLLPEAARETVAETPALGTGVPETSADPTRDELAEAGRQLTGVPGSWLAAARAARAAGPRLVGISPPTQQIRQQGDRTFTSVVPTPPSTYMTALKRALTDNRLDSSGPAVERMLLSLVNDVGGVPPQDAYAVSRDSGLGYLAKQLIDQAAKGQGVDPLADLTAARAGGRAIPEDLTSFMPLLAALRERLSPPTPMTMDAFLRQVQPLNVIGGR